MNCKSYSRIDKAFTAEIISPRRKHVFLNINTLSEECQPFDYDSKYRQRKYFIEDECIEKNSDNRKVCFAKLIEVNEYSPTSFEELPILQEMKENKSKPAEIEDNIALNSHFQDLKQIDKSGKKKLKSMKDLIEICKRKNETYETLINTMKNTTLSQNLQDIPIHSHSSNRITQVTSHKSSQHLESSQPTNEQQGFLLPSTYFAIHIQKNNKKQKDIAPHYAKKFNSRELKLEHSSSTNELLKASTAMCTPHNTRGRNIFNAYSTLNKNTCDNPSKRPISLEKAINTGKNSSQIQICQPKKAQDSHNSRCISTIKQRNTRIDKQTKCPLNKVIARCTINLKDGKFSEVQFVQLHTKKIVKKATVKPKVQQKTLVKGEYNSKSTVRLTTSVDKKCNNEGGVRVRSRNEIHYFNGSRNHIPAYNKTVAYSES